MSLFSRNRTRVPETFPEWPKPVAERAVAPFESVDDGTGAWIPAGLVEVHDEVNVRGDWLKVTGTTTMPSRFDQMGAVVLHFGARVESMSYLPLVYARDSRGGAR